MVGYGNHTPVMKRSMEAEFTEKLHSIAFRATKAECLDLPETTDGVQRVDLEPAALRAYRQLVKDSYAELSEGSVTVTNVLTRLLRLSQLTGGFVGTEPKRPQCGMKRGESPGSNGVCQAERRQTTIANCGNDDSDAT